MFSFFFFFSVVHYTSSIRLTMLTIWSTFWTLCFWTTVWVSRVIHPGEENVSRTFRENQFSANFPWKLTRISGCNLDILSQFYPSRLTPTRHTYMYVCYLLILLYACWPWHWQLIRIFLLHLTHSHSPFALNYQKGEKNKKKIFHRFVLPMESFADIFNSACEFPRRNKRANCFLLFLLFFPVVLYVWSFFS